MGRLARLARSIGLAALARCVSSRDRFAPKLCCIAPLARFVGPYAPSAHSAESNRWLTPQARASWLAGLIHPVSSLAWLVSPARPAGSLRSASPPRVCCYNCIALNPNRHIRSREHKQGRRIHGRSVRQECFGTSECEARRARYTRRGAVCGPFLRDIARGPRSMAVLAQLCRRSVSSRPERRRLALAPGGITRGTGT